MGKFRSPWGNKTTIAIAIFIILFLWFVAGESGASV